MGGWALGELVEMFCRVACIVDHAAAFANRTLAAELRRIHAWVVARLITEPDNEAPDPAQTEDRQQHEPEAPALPAESVAGQGEGDPGVFAGIPRAAGSQCVRLTCSLPFASWMRPYVQ
jgi:hypothetical protein